MQELLGAPVAQALTLQLSERVDALKAQGITPKLAIVRLGENPGDMAYERGALNRMNKVGIEVDLYPITAECSQQGLNGLLQELSADSSVHGVLLMRPLPDGLDEASAAACLDPAKDVDGMTVGSLAHVFSGAGLGFAPCTAQAVMAILEHYGVELEGKRVAVLGRSLVIGKPVAQLLLANNATVTQCHSKTKNLKQICQDSDIIVSCMGRAHMLTSDYFTEPCCVIDVSTNDDGNGSITGDVDTAQLADVNISVTPVPRGVGSVTTSILAAHVVESAQHSVIL